MTERGVRTGWHEIINWIVSWRTTKNVNGNIVSSNHCNLFIYFSAIYTQLQVLNNFLEIAQVLQQWRGSCKGYSWWGKIIGRRSVALILRRVTPMWKWVGILIYLNLWRGPIQIWFQLYGYLAPKRYHFKINSQINDMVILIQMEKCFLLCFPLKHGSKLHLLIGNLQY